MPEPVGICSLDFWIDGHCVTGLPSSEQRQQANVRKFTLQVMLQFGSLMKLVVDRARATPLGGFHSMLKQATSLVGLEQSVI